MTAGPEGGEQGNPERDRGVGQTRVSSSVFASVAAQSGEALVGSVSRRAALGLISAGVLTGIGACSRRDAAKGEIVVLYSSVDDEYLRLVVGVFEKSTGIRVLVKGDTEATKTTGLVERLRAEHAAGKPGADVWWSSEPFLTVALADEGVLTPMPDEAFGDLPAEWRGEGNLWGCFARRARVVVRRDGGGPGYTDIFSHEGFLDRAPVIARPAFGTTRGHFGWILATVGEECFAKWLRALRAGGARVVDGNSAVVRLVATGEAECGLTDTDDVWAGQAQGWPVQCDEAAILLRFRCLEGQPIQGYQRGPMEIPNSVALVRGGANPAGGAALVTFLMSETSERMLMESNSHNMPVRESLMETMARGERSRFVLLPCVKPDPEVLRESKAGVNGCPPPLTLRQIAAAAPRAVELARAEGLA